MLSPFPKDVFKERPGPAWGEKIKKTIDDIQNNEDYGETYALLSYDKKIALFNKQLNELIMNYEEDIKTFGNVIVNNKSLSSYKKKIENYVYS